MATAEWEVVVGPASITKVIVNDQNIAREGLREVHMDVADGEVSTLVLVFKGQGSVTGEGIVMTMGETQMALEELDPDEIEADILSAGDNSSPFSHQMLDYIKGKIG